MQEFFVKNKNIILGRRSDGGIQILNVGEDFIKILELNLQPNKLDSNH